MKKIELILPPQIQLADYNFSLDPTMYLVNLEYSKDVKTYSEYNYLNNSISARIKRTHFKKALRITQKYFHKANVIDFGCADGFFLPSLSKYFNHVLGVDHKEEFIQICSIIKEKMNLSNVTLLCNKNVDFKELSSRMPDGPYNIIFLLEVLEHVGEKEQLYSSKIAFLENLMELLSDDGISVISVPNMVGFSFLLQRIGLTLSSQVKVPMSWKNFLKAVLLKNTDDLEAEWTPLIHPGFNHLKLERFLTRKFKKVQKLAGIFQVFYVIGK